MSDSGKVEIYKERSRRHRTKEIQKFQLHNLEHICSSCFTRASVRNAEKDKVDVYSRRASSYQLMTLQVFCGGPNSDIGSACIRNPEFRPRQNSFLSDLSLITEWAL